MSTARHDLNTITKVCECVLSLEFSDSASPILLPRVFWSGKAGPLTPEHASFGLAPLLLSVIPPLPSQESGGLPALSSSTDSYSLPPGLCPLASPNSAPRSFSGGHVSVLVPLRLHKGQYACVDICVRHQHYYGLSLGQSRKPRLRVSTGAVWSSEVVSHHRPKCCP